MECGGCYSGACGGGQRPAGDPPPSVLNGSTVVWDASSGKRSNAVRRVTARVGVWTLQTTSNAGTSLALFMLGGSGKKRSSEPLPPGGTATSGGAAPDTVVARDA